MVSKKDVCALCANIATYPLHRMPDGSCGIYDEQEVCKFATSLGLCEAPSTARDAVHAVTGVWHMLVTSGGSVPICNT